MCFPAYMLSLFLCKLLTSWTLEEFFRSSGSFFALFSLSPFAFSYRISWLYGSTLASFCWKKDNDNHLCSGSSFLNIWAISSKNWSFPKELFVGPVEALIWFSCIRGPKQGKIWLRVFVSLVACISDINVLSFSSACCALLTNGGSNFLYILWCNVAPGLVLCKISGNEFLCRSLGWLHSAGW